MIDVDVYTKLGWKGLMTYRTKSLFLRDYTEPNRMGVFAKMQIISVNSQSIFRFAMLNVIDAESPIVIFFFFFFFFWAGAIGSESKFLNNKHQETTHAEFQLKHTQKLITE